MIKLPGATRSGFATWSNRLGPSNCTRDQIVRAGRRPHWFHRTDCQRIWIISGCIDRSVALGARSIIAAIVPGRHHDEDSRFPCRLHGLAKWILGIALEYSSPDRQIDDSYVVSVL